MPTMRLKKQDGTWDKVPVLGSYQAVLAANEAATNAQNAANTAEKIATDLGLVDEAVQTAVSSAEQASNSATTASNKADVATAKADVATTKASEAGADADTATQKAEAASISATNAAQSYTNANAVATQLTEYLATKETLTAPAVDKTLLIEGAAADSKVVGELKSDLISVEDALVKHVSRNHFDRENAINKTINSTPVIISQKVKVKAGDKYYLSEHKSNANTLVQDSFWGIYQHNVDGTVTTSQHWITEYIVPEGIVEIQFIIAQVDYQYIMVEKDIQTLKWEEYYAPYYECVDMKAREEIETLKVNKDTEEFILPSALYGVVGKETNIYYQNILNHSSMNTICGCDIGGKIAKTERFRDRLIWTPSASGKITDTITCYKKSWDDAILSKSIPFISAPTDSGNNEIKVVTIGDSKIAYGEVIGYLFDMFENDNHVLTLLGSRYGNNNSGDARQRHDGYSGWSSYDFAYENRNELNPFYNADYTDSQYGTHFDFSYYMTNLGYSDVDYVFINLGTNDFPQSLNDIIWQTDAMIKSIHLFDANIKIAVGLNEPVYSKKMEWRTRNEMFYALNKRKIAKYDNRASENIFVLPLYPSIDSVNDYDNGVSIVPLSYADSIVGTGKTREYNSDGIHESRAGFYKYANCMYSFIKCVESGLVN